MKTEIVEIIDRGRGPQLSNSRITVLDIVHYFQRKASYDEIIQSIPTLSREAVALIERYYLDHKDQFDELERRVQLHREEQIRLQRLKFPEFTGTHEERITNLRQLLDQRSQEKNGEGYSG
jgi:uncharacterized protein (DUF433 family)